jgi:NADPH-dependent glutamate synthase beta subunit-like oxidoreductase
MRKGLGLAQAIAEADRCLLCHDAPCSEGCPAETQPGEFIRKLRFKNITGAIRTIKQNNILGGACGRCLRGFVSDPSSVRGKVQRDV